MIRYIYIRRYMFYICRYYYMPVPPKGCFMTVFSQQCLGLQLQITWTPDLVTTLIHHKAPMPIWCQPQTFGISGILVKTVKTSIATHHHLSELTRPFLGERKLLVRKRAPHWSVVWRAKRESQRKAQHGMTSTESTIVHNKIGYCPPLSRLCRVQMITWKVKTPETQSRCNKHRLDANLCKHWNKVSLKGAERLVKDGIGGLNKWIEFGCAKYEKFVWKKCLVMWINDFKSFYTNVSF